MNLSSQDELVDHEPFHGAHPADGVLVTTLPLFLSNSSGDHGLVTADVDCVWTGALHIGAWVTITVEDMDGKLTFHTPKKEWSLTNTEGYLAAMQDPDTLSNSEVDSINLITAIERLIHSVHAEIQERSEDPVLISPHEEPGEEAVIALARVNVASSISGDTAKEPSLAGSTQVDSTAQDAPNS
ncbi:hypothetical protein T440DRAFT_67071 [Plenodomus tracheiphilus IPT5]|uniref:Uncharacterized protein n=1 Tax=Plenodomus tracheiphilus IPT5 TaxID=1408161 RepID=A0A6A7B826_9PLEO|nr:hypothetical protein T440DRAFT_67071 [Plenodomus tracheiphilus IPT5]